MAKKTAGRTSAKRRYGQAASKSVETAMRRKNKGTLRSGKGGRGGKVSSRKQAIAIGLSEAREAGAKVPPNPNARGARKTAQTRKTAKTATKQSSARKGSSAQKTAKGTTRKRSSSVKRTRS